MHLLKSSILVLVVSQFSQALMASEGADSQTMVQPQTPSNETETEHRLVGEINATRKSQLAFKVGGFIESVSAKPGDTVKKGAVLASLEQRDFKLKFDLAKSRRAQAKISLENAEKEFQREVALRKENASTESNYDRIKTAQEQAQIALQLADLELKSAENALKDSKLTAPYDCVVATQLKYEGESVQSGVGAFEVVDITAPEITLRAPERLLGQIKIGEEIAIKVPAAGYMGAAKVVRVVSIVNEKTRTFSVTAHFNKSDSNLVPGLYAEGTIKKVTRPKQ